MRKLSLISHFKVDKFLRFHSLNHSLYFSLCCTW